MGREMNGGKIRERGKCTKVKRLAFAFSKGIILTAFVIPTIKWSRKL
jgi:hypothetical protein